MILLTSPKTTYGNLPKYFFFISISLFLYSFLLISNFLGNQTKLWLSMLLLLTSSFGPLSHVVVNSVCLFLDFYVVLNS